MELHELRKLRGKLNRFVAKFDDCIGTRPSCRHFRTYINGQLGPLRRKNVETIALASGTHVRTLQHFLSLHGWDEMAVGRRVREWVRSRHADENAIGVIDETSYAKKGDKTAGVKRQYCGATGKTDNCVVSVHLGYAAGDFHTLLDGDLYLPRDWAEDHERRQEAGIPATVSYRPKWKIALDLLRRSLEEGVSMRWLTADEAYGRCTEFREAVAAFGLSYVVEIPTDLTGWTRLPEVLPSGTVVPSGRRLRKPRVAEDQAKARLVKNLWHRGGPSWDLYRIKDSDKGPVVWEVRESRFHPNRNGVPGPEVRLIVARNMLDDEVKYFLSNADMDVPLQAVLHVAFSRYHIEQLFREGKGTVGLDEFQVRNYLPLQRHLAMTLVSLLFLAEQTAILRGKKSPLESLSGPRGNRSPTGTDDVAA
jgi:SRSO17 transposase